MDSENKFGSYFRRFFSGTLVSRITGFARDLAMAFAFGDHISVAAFMVAFRLSNLLRRLLGEGPFQSAFVPVFQGIRLKGEKEAGLFFSRITAFMTLFLIVVIICGVGGAGLLSYSSYFSEETKEIFQMTAWMLPGLFFICLYGLNLSLLSCYNSFFISSVAPAACNLVWIAVVLFYREADPSYAMNQLSKWLVVGFFFQWLLTLPSTLKFTQFSWKSFFRFSFSSDVASLLKGFTFGVIGVGAMQINAFADAFFARFADLKGPVYLWYAIRLEQLALAILGIACVTTVVPALSKLIKNGEKEKAKALFKKSFDRLLFIMVPATFIIFALGTQSVHLIYGGGSFSDLAVIKTALCLFAYSAGLIPATLVIFFSSVFYAEGDFKRPMWLSLASVGINLFLNALFVFFLDFGAVSIALATSASSWFNSESLRAQLKAEGWKISWKQAAIGKIVMASLVATLGVLILDTLVFSSSLFEVYTTSLFPHSFKGIEFLELVAQFGVFIIIFFFSSLFVRNYLAKEFWISLKSYLKKQPKEANKQREEQWSQF